MYNFRVISQLCRKFDNDTLLIYVIGIQIDIFRLKENTKYIIYTIINNDLLLNILDSTLFGRSNANTAQRSSILLCQLWDVQVCRVHPKLTLSSCNIGIRLQSSRPSSKVGTTHFDSEIDSELIHLGYN